MGNEKIDIIVPWVNNLDEEWQKSRACHYRLNHPDALMNSEVRFQSWDNLQYWFRAVERFLPWVNKIFFVTCGHVPEFLNRSHPKLRIVKHSEYMPQEYLPTFNSNAIEWNYHRIEELSENFVLFNDDLFPLQAIEKEYYFQNGIVCDEAVEGHISPVNAADISHYSGYVAVNNIMVINKYFKKREVQKKNWDKWYFEGYGELLERTKSLSYWYDFSGFHDPHMAVALKKSTFTMLWEKEREELTRTSKNRFRSFTDVSQHLARYWQICEGNFVPRRTLGKFYFVTMDNYKEVADAIRNRQWQMVSLNENCTGEEFSIIKGAINGALEEILPDKCSYEL